MSRTSKTLETFVPILSRVSSILRGRAFLLLAVAVYLGSFGLAVRTAIAEPGLNWDLLGYVGSVVSLETRDPVDVRLRTLADFKTLAWPELYVEYSETNRLSADAGNFSRQLPFYKIKPLYVGLIWLVHQLGAPTLSAAAGWVSAAAFAVLALIMLWWKPVAANRGVWLLLLAGLSVWGEQPLRSLAWYATPDGLCLALLMSAYVAWIHGRSSAAYGVLSLLAVLARPDAVLLISAVTFYFVFFAEEGWRMSRPVGAAVAVASGIAYIAVQTLWGGGGWSVWFYRFFIDVNFDFSKVDVHVTWAQYKTVLLWSLAVPSKDPRLWFFLLLSAVAIALHFYRPTNGREWMWLLLVIWSALVARYLSLPFWEVRYYFPFFLLILIASLELIGTAIDPGARRQRTDVT